jgi:uncharacterized protein YihD (DUF1040 family)
MEMTHMQGYLVCMNESLLQFIWHHQYFNLWDLKTVNGEALEIVDPGIWNRDQGPDFLTGRIRVNGEEWAGNIELHVRTSEWELHGHSTDPNYNNVVLHVVWEHDADTGPAVPVLELRSRVPQHLQQKYSRWMTQENVIPCAGEISAVNPEIIYGWLDWLFLRRSEHRSQQMMLRVEALRMDWEEAFWRSLARAFGYKVNADAFEAIAGTLPVKLMMRHRNNPMQLEALLLGQAGLLRTDNGDEYSKNLFREYGFLRKKYRLIKTYQPVHFLRMRPGNFPTVRLAQLAALVARNADLFRALLDLRTTSEIRDFFRVEAGEYWDHHYRFGESSLFLRKKTGEQFISNLLINTVIPFLVAYHQHAGNQNEIGSLMRMMEELDPELNSITASFSRLGIKCEHAAHTQALLELKKDYCEQLKCLDCTIGRSVLKRTTPVIASHH